MKIPTYESEGNIHGAEMDPRVAGQSGAMISKVGEGITDLGAHFQKIQDQAQTTAAEMSLYQRMNDINTTAASDPDVWSLPDRVQPMMTQAVDESAKGIKSAAARSEYQNKANLLMARHSVTTMNMIRTRQLQDAKGKVLQLGDTLSSQYWNSANDGEREQIRQQFTDKVNEAVTSGIIHPKVAEEYKKSTLNSMTDGQVEKDMELSASNTLKELEKGDKGIYKNIDSAKRERFIGQAKRVTEKQKIQGNEIHAIAMNKAETDLTQRYFDGNLKAEDVVRARIGGRISQEFYDSVLKADQSPKKTHATDAKAYMDLIDDLHNPDIKPEVKRKKLLDMSAAGTISQTDAKHLYTAKMVPTEDGSTSIAGAMAQQKTDSRQKIIDDAEKAKAVHKEQNGFWKSAIDYLKNWGHKDGKDDKKTADVVQDFYRKVNEGKTKPDEALTKAKEIVNQKNIEANPEVVKSPKTGRLMMDAHGNKALVFPDGSYEAQ